jgi:hypothetical protein
VGSLFRRRPKTTVSILLFILIFSYVVFCGLTILNARSFRKHPQRTNAVAYFRGDLPHNILGRMLLFKRGTKEYNSDLLEWAYHSKLISDKPWNRWILEKNFENASEEERTRLLPYYPLSPTERLMPFIKKALDQDRYQVLPLLSKANTAQSLQIYRGWVQERVLKPRNLRLFVAASGSLAQSSAYPFAELVKIFWPKLSPSQRERVMAKVAAHFPEEPRTVNELFNLAKSSLVKDDLTLGCASVALIGRFLSVDQLRDQAVELVAQHASNIKASQIRLLLRFVNEKDMLQVAKLVLEKLKDKNPPALVELLDYVANRDITQAEELAPSLLRGEDSEMRKGVIVVLVRNGSVKGKALIEETFKGRAPRKTMYWSFGDYEYGSVAADKYHELSTHDYEETGKTWPPSYLRNGPSGEEVASWKEFILSYPLFSGH